MIMMTGLSGSGKSTLALALQAALTKENIKSEVIDGDVYRHTINKDLGFSEADRRENIRRLFNIAGTAQQQGVIAIVAAINPYNDFRAQLSSSSGAKIVYIKCSIEQLVNRDTKGLYKRAFLPDGHPQKLKDLSGINDRYDIPSDADLVIDTTSETVEQSAIKLVDYVMTVIHS
jgi:adenylylsulfate kinase